jgi:hypothetical protein
MAFRHRFLVIIPAIILIPILLGTTPMNLVHKLSGRCPLCQEKQLQRAGSCLFHSLVSQDDLNIVYLNSASSEQESTPSLHSQVLDYDPFHSNISLESFPLRC